MSEQLSTNAFIAMMQDSFDRGQNISFVPSGSSMLPMLDGKSDKVTFSEKPDRLKKYDVAFYLRPQSGQPVLHRMIGFTRDGGYIFSGDNQYFYEYGIEDDNVLALMTAFTHKGREYLVTDFRYRFYIRRMMLKKRARILLSKVYHRVWKKG